MRPHTLQQQQQHHQQQYCGIDSNLPQQQQQQQQQHSSKNPHLNYLNTPQGLQQQTAAVHLHQQQQQNYHHQQQQHQLHHLNHGPLQQQPPLPQQPPQHMWSAQLNPAHCYPPQPPPSSAANNGNSPQMPNSSGAHINLQNCRPYPARHGYGHPATHANHHATNSFSHPPLHAAGHSNDRMPLTAPNYAKLPPLSVVNQQRINECAGIPLISTATAHLTPGQRQRISRKQSHSPPGRNWPNVLPTNNQAQNYAAAQYAAAHAQGAPLMLNKSAQKPEYWSPNAYAAQQQQQQQQQQYTNKAMQFSNPSDRTRTPLRYQNSAPASLASTRSKENQEQQIKLAKDTENSSSNNGDSSNSNETCLPRIIKPRKRRKKDRKPTNNMVQAVYMKMDAKTGQEKLNNVSVGGGGSMKPYKSSEDLMKCLQKFTQINSLQEDNRTRRPQANSSMFESQSQDSMQLQCTSGRTDINHGICFCSACDPLRSIWDYPLRRSLSDSSSSSTSGTGSLSDENKQPETERPKTRAEIVGVIGSKRNKEHYNSTSSSTSSTQHEYLDTNPDHGLYNTNILQGINIANELFKQNINLTSFADLNNPLSSLLPETAETLLTKSINEISKKLIETCSNETPDLPLSVSNSFTSCSSSSSTSSSANSTCADFSNDSGIESAHINAGDDLVFNFDHLHITATKLSLSSSSTTSSCGNISTSSTSPTVKFATNFLTTQTSSSASASTTTTTTTPPHQTPLTPNNQTISTATPIKAAATAAPTLEFLVDLNNNQLHHVGAITTTTTATATNDMNVTQNIKQQQQQRVQQFNDLVQNHHHQQKQQQHNHHQHHPPQQQLQSLAQPPHRQHDQQFFNNCFDLMWQQQERQLGNTNNNNNNNFNNNDQLISSSSASTVSNNVALSSFLDSVGSLKTVFSTIS